MHEFIPRCQDVDFQLLRAVIALQAANAIATLALEGEMDFVTDRFQNDIGF